MNKHQWEMKDQMIFKRIHFDVMHINDDIFKARLFEGGLLNEGYFVACNADFKLWQVELSTIMSVCFFILVRAMMFLFGVHCSYLHTQFWKVNLVTMIRCRPAMVRWCLK